MNRKKFQEIIDDVLGTIKSGRGKNAVYTSKPHLEVRWKTGGLSGGSCWDTGDEDTRYYSEEGDPEVEFDELDEILERVCPDISYLKFRKLEKLIEHDSATENEYYGNYSIYSIKRLVVEKLWDFLVEHGYCQADKPKAKRGRPPKAK